MEKAQLRLSGPRGRLKTGDPSKYVTVDGTEGQIVRDDNVLANVCVDGPSHECIRIEVWPQKGMGLSTSPVMLFRDHGYFTLMPMNIFKESDKQRKQTEKDHSFCPECNTWVPREDRQWWIGKCKKGHELLHMVYCDNCHSTFLIRKPDRSKGVLCVPCANARSEDATKSLLTST